MERVQIQLVNYKSKKYLLECLESLFKDLEGYKEAYSVVVLDNASGESLSDVPALFPNLKGLTTIQSQENLGFGGGHNFLAKNSRAQYLLLLNPDAKMIEPGTVRRLLESAERMHAQVLGPRLVTTQGTTQWWDHGELLGLKSWVALNSGNSYWRERKEITPAAWVSGAVFLIEKRWFDDLGGFDENFFLYKEEEELCWRLRNKGGKVFYDPSITIFHHGGVSAKKSEHMQKSVAYFLKKHFARKWYYPFLKLLNKVLH